MFDNHFEVFLADTPEGKQAHYNVRYQVYCDEMGYEDKEKFPQKQEFDQWDEEDAVHFIVRHKHTGQWVGAMRLVFQNGKLLPLEEHCTIDEITSKSHSPDVVELSRLCLVKEIRRRNTEQNFRPYGKGSKGDVIESKDNVQPIHNNRRFSSGIIFGLLHAALDYSANHNINTWYCLGAEALARIVRKRGLTMERAGDAINHRGERFPFTMDVAETNSNDFWEGFSSSYRLYSELEIAEANLLKCA